MARQAELRSHFSPILIDGVAESAETLCTNSFGCQFVTEVLLGAGGKTYSRVPTALLGIFLAAEKLLDKLLGANLSRPPR